MSKFSSPIPVATKIVDDLELSIPWKKWFQSLGNDWVSSNQTITLAKKVVVDGKVVSTPTSFNYVINGSICFYQFIGSTTEIIDLPYSVGVDSIIDGVIIPKGTKSITFTTPTFGFYFIQLQ